MREPIEFPTIEGPLESWCVLCAHRNVSPEASYCGECRPAYQSFRERLRPSVSRRLLAMVFGDPHPARAFLVPNVRHPRTK